MKYLELTDNANRSVHKMNSNHFIQTNNFWGLKFLNLADVNGITKVWLIRAHSFHFLWLVTNVHIWSKDNVNINTSFLFSTVDIKHKHGKNTRGNRNAIFHWKINMGKELKYTWNKLTFSRVSLAVYGIWNILYKVL